MPSNKHGLSEAERAELLEQGRDAVSGRFVKGNKCATLTKGSRSAITQRMLDHAMRLKLTPEEVLASLFEDLHQEPELRLKAAKIYGDWTYFKAPNIEISVEAEMESAEDIEDQVGAYLQEVETTKKERRFARIRKYGRKAMAVSEADFEEFEELYGAIPDGLDTSDRKEAEDEFV